MPATLLSLVAFGKISHEISSTSTAAYLQKQSQLANTLRFKSFNYNPSYSTNQIATKLNN